jgi:hypothetical protein
MAGRLRSSPWSYKRRPSTPPPSHRPSILPLSFPPLLSSTTVAEPDTTGEMPLQRLLTRSDPAVELTDPSFPSPAPWPKLSGTEAAGGRAPGSSHARQWSPVHHGPVAPNSTALWTESMDFSVQKLFQKIYFFYFSRDICKKPMELQTFITFQPQLQIQ